MKWGLNEATVPLHNIVYFDVYSVIIMSLYVYDMSICMVGYSLAPFADDSDNTALIAGIVIGVTLALAVVLLVTVLVILRKKRSQK